MFNYLPLNTYNRSMTKFPKYPHFNYDEIVEHCRNWAREARVECPDLTKINQTKAIVIIDSLTYLIRSQEWIDYKKEELLKSILDSSNRIVQNHTKQTYWSRLFSQIDKLKKKDQIDAERFSTKSMQESKSKLHEFARREVIDHCKAWAENARFEYLEIVTGDKDWAQHSTDRLTYPLTIHNYIDWKREPELSEIVHLTEEIEQNHTSPAKWEKLIKLIDSL